MLLGPLVKGERAFALTPPPDENRFEFPGLPTKIIVNPVLLRKHYRQLNLTDFTLNS